MRKYVLFCFSALILLSFCGCGKANTVKSAASAAPEVSETASPANANNEGGPSGVVKFEFLQGLIGKTKAELISSVSETPAEIDEGGLSFDKIGFRVWFDPQKGEKVSQIGILSDKIDINGVHVGESLDAFKKIFGKPVKSTAGEDHFKYSGNYLIVDYNQQTNIIAQIYIVGGNYYSEYFPE